MSVSNFSFSEEVVRVLTEENSPLLEKVLIASNSRTESAKLLAEANRGSSVEIDQVHYSQELNAV